MKIKISVRVMAGRMVEPQNEFSRIGAYFAPLSNGHDGAYLLQDDAATLAPSDGCELVISTDMIVAGVHFLGSESAEDIAAKLLGVNLSDLAGKGARPLAYTLNLALPASVGDHWLDAFAGELGRQQQKFNFYLLGGDSVILPPAAPITLAVTIYGETRKGQMLRRNAARAGDLICVSGSIGDGALGLLAARGELGRGEAAQFLIHRYRRPSPRVALGQMMREKAHAAMDISDGLLADLGHLADASGLLAEIDIPSVPLSSAAVEILAESPELMERVLTGGDDYELLFTIDSNRPEYLQELARHSATALSVIGRMRPGEGCRARDRAGAVVAFSETGYRHI